MTARRVWIGLGCLAALGVAVLAWSRGVVPSWNVAARAAGKVTVTGPDGVAWVPLLSDLGYVRRLEVEAPGRFGQMWPSWRAVQSARDDGITLRLRPTVALIVEVVGADGVPAPGVTVDWVFRSSAPRRAPEEKDSYMTLGWTGEDGRVTHAHAETLADVATSDGADHGGATLVASGVSARVFGAVTDPAPLPIDHLPDNVVRIVLPPTGGLRLELPRGTMNFDALLLIEPTVARSGTLDWNRRTMSRGPGDARPQGNLEFVDFAPLALGVRCRVILTESNNVPLIDTVVAGPTRPGELATVRLEPEVPVLVGRLVGSDGEPQRVRDVYAFVGAGEHERQLDLRTTGDGGFRIPTNSELVGLDVSWIRFQVQGSDPGTARVELPQPLHPGIVDLGDVVVEPMPLLASGRCVDEAGAPIERPGFSAKSADGGRAFSWPEVESVGDADGRVELFGYGPDRSLTLVARAQGFLPSEPRTVAVGSTDLLFVLRREGKLVATAANVKTHHDLGARLQRADGNTIDGFGADLPNGVVEWHWRSIEPGRYRFELRRAVTSEVLVAVDDVEVVGGETTRDPRLTDIQVPGVTTFRLRIFDADGGSLPDRLGNWGGLPGYDEIKPHVFFPRADGSLGGRPLGYAGEREFWVSAPPAPQRLLIAAPGRRATFVTWSGGDLDVRLRRTTRVVVRVPADARIGTVALSGGPQLHLVPNPGSYSGLDELDRWPGLTARVVQDGVATFEVPEPGPYTIELTGPDAAALGPAVVDVPDVPQVEIELSR